MRIRTTLDGYILLTVQMVIAAVAMDTLVKTLPRYLPPSNDSLNICDLYSDDIQGGPKTWDL